MPRQLPSCLLVLLPRPSSDAPNGEKILQLFAALEDTLQAFTAFVSAWEIGRRRCASALPRGLGARCDGRPLGGAAPASASAIKLALGSLDKAPSRIETFLLLKKIW